MLFTTEECDARNKVALLAYLNQLCLLQETSEYKHCFIQQHRVLWCQKLRTITISYLDNGSDFESPVIGLHQSTKTMQVVSRDDSGVHGQVSVSANIQLHAALRYESVATAVP